MELLQYFQACLEADYIHEANGASWTVEDRGEEVWILFEKSNGITDWMNNLQYHAVPYREMNPVWQCHSGFLKVWKSVKPHLEGPVAEAKRRGRRVRVIGYSHGAAIAVLCHEWIYYRFPALRQSLCGFGFGCPRVLYGCVSQNLAQRWKKFYVVRNGEDAVTHLPPRALGYCHVGNLVAIGKDRGYSPIDAHRPENYRKELQSRQELPPFEG